MSNSATEDKKIQKPRRSFRVRRVASLIVACAFLVAIAAVSFQVGLWQAQVSIENRDHNIGRNWLDGVAWIWPRNAEWYYLSARVNRRLENYDQVHSDLKSAYDLGWPVSQLDYEQLLAQAQTGQFRKVAPHWSTLFQNAGSDGPEICKAYVKYSLSRFRLDNAAKVLNEWKADFPNDAEPYFTEGQITLVLQRWKEAEGLFTKTLEMEPAHDQARLGLVEALMKQLKYEDAIVEINKLLQERRSPELLADLAHSYIQLGRTDEAQQVLKEGLLAATEHEQLNSEMGRLLTKTGRPKAAIPYLERVVKQHPEQTEIRYVLAKALKAIGENEEARQHFKFVDEGTKALLELSRLTSQVVQNPSDVETRYRVAEITWRWKSRDDGEAWLKSVLEFDPDHEPTHSLLAKHYKLTGKADKAAYHDSLVSTMNRAE